VYLISLMLNIEGVEVNLCGSTALNIISGLEIAFGAAERIGGKRSGLAVDGHGQLAALICDHVVELLSTGHIADRSRLGWSLLSCLDTHADVASVVVIQLAHWLGGYLVSDVDLAYDSGPSCTDDHHSGVEAVSGG